MANNIYAVDNVLVGDITDRPPPEQAVRLFIDIATGATAFSDGTEWIEIGAIATAGIAASGPGGSATTIVAIQINGQTGFLYLGIGADGLPKFSVSSDGELISSDDILAPTGTIRGATLALVPSGTGAPTTGTHGQCEFHADTAGGLFYCIEAGTPGTWKSISLV